jgi:hypothetical protein
MKDWDSGKGPTEERLADELELFADLDEVGIAIIDLQQLVKCTAAHPEAIPVLVDHIQRDYHGEEAKAIAEALMVADARPWLDSLIAEYERTDYESNQTKKDSLAMTIGRIGRGYMPKTTIERLFNEARHDKSRILLHYGLKNPI